jgi:hypothetical protein
MQRGRPHQYVVYKRVGHLFETKSRGSIEAKNKGQLAMYYLDRIMPELSADADGINPDERFRAEARRV